MDKLTYETGKFTYENKKVYGPATFTYENKDIEAGIVNEAQKNKNTNKKTKSWFIRIMSVLLTDKAIRMRGGGGGGKRAGNDYYEIV